VTAELVVVELGPHLHRLRDLFVFTNCRDGVLFDVRRRLVEPLRAAMALTALEFSEGNGGPSAVLLTTDRIDDLLAGNPALRRFAFQKEHALERDLDLAALRARHPAVEFALDGGDGWWTTSAEED
jgi:hypothetical protein